MFDLIVKEPLKLACFSRFAVPFQLIIADSFPFEASDFQQPSVNLQFLQDH